jgi:hypothetical protein
MKDDEVSSVIERSVQEFRGRLCKVVAAMERHTWSDIKARTTPEVRAPGSKRRPVFSLKISALARPKGPRRLRPKRTARTFGTSATKTWIRAESPGRRTSLSGDLPRLPDRIEEGHFSELLRPRGGPRQKAVVVARTGLPKRRKHFITRPTRDGVPR